MFSSVIGHDLEKEPVCFSLFWPQTSGLSGFRFEEMERFCLQSIVLLPKVFAGNGCNFSLFWSWIERTTPGVPAHLPDFEKLLSSSPICAKKKKTKINPYIGRLRRSQSTQLPAMLPPAVGSSWSGSRLDFLLPRSSGWRRRARVQVFHTGKGQKMTREGSERYNRSNLEKSSHLYRCSVSICCRESPWLTSTNYSNIQGFISRAPAVIPERSLTGI